jgi:hypothetical protein
MAKYEIDKLFKRFKETMPLINGNDRYMITNIDTIVRQDDQNGFVFTVVKVI